MKATELPERMLKLIAPADRKALKVETAAEAQAKGEARGEKHLQKMIINALRLRGIEPIVNRMDRKTSNNLGTPDLLFAVMGYMDIESHQYPRVFACAWEVKLQGKKLEPHQEAFANQMRKSPNHWTHRVIHSVDEALEQLKAMGLE